MSEETVTVPGLARPLPLRRSRRASRLSLKLDATGAVVVVAPFSLPRREVDSFVARHAGWVRARLAEAPETLPFADGAEVPYLGRPHRIVHDAALPRTVRRDEGVLTVGGPAPHLSARLIAWLALEARRELALRSRTAAGQLGARLLGVSVRDTRSRWGSCSADGRISYCWRLILAPEPVVDYVVAHEVAHLVELNHSRRFWALVGQLHPDVPASRAWLKANGARLHRYGMGGVHRPGGEDFFL